MTEEFVRLQPSEGKYLSATVDGRAYDIYLVDPETGTQGTLVPRKVAIVLMASRHPIVTTVPEIKDGKFVSVFTKEERELIAEIRKNPTISLKKHEQETNATLEALVLTQANQMKAMQDEIAELKKSKKTSKKDVEE